MWDFVDGVIYINLEHRSDRREIMQTFFKESGIPLEKVVRFNAIPHEIGAIGCLQSHLEALRLAKKNQWKNVLILEDDLKWIGGYDRLEELIELPKWDVILLLGYYRKYDFPRVYFSTNAGAYLVNYEYYDILLKNREECYSQLMLRTSYNILRRRTLLYDPEQYFRNDTYWQLLMERDSWYGLNPCICTQIDGFSDVVKKKYRPSHFTGIHSSDYID